ncbi:sensor histidine kinase [Enterobacter ludwigii]|uniref:sensor histidine kinase n=1 Tax=Enterobacter ludwigii TaxID=299767 RepID=UPI0013D62D1E|nr:sensor histidine kinase [Enterobacter ludwigii]WRM15350.1 ATP-binding protein [Enterobacter ludwigii]
MLTRETALELLSSESSHQRFLAVRMLEKSADSRDLITLIRAKKNEKDAVVLKWIDRAIETCQKQDVVQDVSVNDVTDTSDFLAIKAQAVEWVAGMLLHEIGNKLGLIAFYASRDVANYEDSNTHKHIANLQLIFDGISKLKQSATQIQIEQFDLHHLIVEMAEFERLNHSVEINYVGIRPFIIESGKQLISLALSNGIRNAIESMIEMLGDNNFDYSPQLTIIWEETPKEYWISINDNGTGLPPNMTALFNIGKSSKEGHAGYGLAIARQALETMNGTVELSNSTTGGAKYLIKWSK